MLVLIYQLTTTSPDSPLVLLTSDQIKNNNEYTEMFNNLVIEYDRRLEEQVKLAKQDMLNELEIQIQVRHFAVNCRFGLSILVFISW